MPWAGAEEIIEERKEIGHGTWGAFKELGVATAAAKNRLMEARKFARLCDDDELDFLCDLRHPQGWELTRTHVLQLIRVENPKLRLHLACKCAKNTWSERGLQLEIDRRGLHRTYGGRKQKRPKSVKVALTMTERMIGSWFRWFIVLTTRPKRSRKKLMLDKLPEPIIKEFVAATDKLSKLYKHIEQELRRSTSADAEDDIDRLYCKVLEELRIRSDLIKTERLRKRKASKLKQARRRKPRS